MRSTRWPLVVALALGPSTALAAPRTFGDGFLDVAFLHDGEWAAESEVAARIRDEITEVTGENFQVRFPDDLVARGDWTGVGVKRALDELAANPKVDVVVVTGALGSDLAARSTPRKPTFAAFVVDPAIQGLPAVKKGSGVRGLNYLALPTSIASDLPVLVEMSGAEHIAVLVAAGLAGSMDAGWRDRLAKAAPEGTTLTVVEVGDTAAPLLAALGADVDGVYITPLPRMSASERDVLAAGLRERKVPAFAMYGSDWVERGLLAARPWDDALPAILRRLALNVEAWLYGDDPGDLATFVDARPSLLIDTDTARAIGASPGWDILSEARLVSAAADEGGRTTLEQAVREALVANVDLAAYAQDVEAGAAAVDRARSPLLPTLTLDANAQAIDGDLAAASFGMLPQYWGRANATLTQVVVDEDRFAGYSSEKSAQEARVATYGAQSSDAVVGAAEVYLAVLRSRAQEGLERSNLEVTRKNLDLARVRERVGAASPAEVHRWEVEVTTDQRHLLDALATRRDAEIGFNRVLNRPMDEAVLLEEAALDRTGALSHAERLVQHFEDPLSLDRLAYYLVDEAVRRSPEVAAIEARVDAAERDLAAAKRSYWAPTISVSGRVSARMFWAGQGKEGDGITMPDDYVPPDWFSWLVGAEASLPLFEGGSRAADVDEGHAYVAQGRLEREAEVERVEARVRSALISVAASWRSLDLADRGAKSAHLALDATTVSYSVGSASVLDLIDAQDVTLESDTAYVDAAYGFHRDLFELMRSLDRFLFLETEEDRTAFFDAVDAWMSGQAGR